MRAVAEGERTEGLCYRCRDVVHGDLDVLRGQRGLDDHELVGEQRVALVGELRLERRQRVLELNYALAHLYSF